MLEYISYAPAELGREVVEDKMRVLLGDGGGLVGPDIVPEGDIVEGEVDGRAMWKVGDDHGVWQGGQYEVRRREIGNNM